MTTRTKHWTDEDLLARLYGADPAPQVDLSHFDDCPDCAARWTRLAGARGAVLAAASAAPCRDETLRAQRLAVWERIERPARTRLLRAAPAAATCLVLLLAVALNHPTPQPVPTQIATAVSDDQLFTDIASVVNADSPRAVEPLRGLFPESSHTEMQ
jgi:hypothetical protein